MIISYQEDIPFFAEYLVLTKTSDVAFGYLKSIYKIDTAGGKLRKNFLQSTYLLLYVLYTFENFSKFHNLCKGCFILKNHKVWAMAKMKKIPTFSNFPSIHLLN